MVSYKIGKVPGTISEVVDNDGLTIDSAIENAGLYSDTMEVRLNGELIEDLDRPVPNGAQIAVSEGRVKGN